MSFDQQLRPTFENLTTRLRDEMERQLDVALRQLTEQAQTFTATSEADREMAIAAAAGAAKSAAEQVASERQRSLEQEAQARLDEAVRHAEARVETVAAEAEQRRQRERAELEAQLAEARTELAEQHQRLSDEIRKAAAQQQEETARFERIVAENETRFERTLADAHARTLSSLQAADLASGSRLVEAFRAIDKAQTLTDILNVLAEAVAAEATRSAIFLAGNAQVKSWKARGFDGLNGSMPIEVPLSEAGLIASALETREPVAVGGDGGDDTDVPAPIFAGLAPDRGAIAVPMVVNEEVVAVVYADQGPSGEVDRASWASVVELLARHASRALEAITAHRLAKTLGSGASRPRTVAKPADVIATPAVAQGARSVAAPSSAVAEPPVPPSDGPSVEAQRFAQSLIAEIRSAHESDVLAGVRERDLMTRLGGPISRAWAQYEARVPESIRTATNYFHAEMVRTLANGDASLLTPNP